MATLLPRLRAELRQRRQHRAFRIAPTQDAPMLAELDRLLTDLRAVAPAEPAAPDDGQRPMDEKGLAEAATSLWRAQRKLAQDQDGASRYSRSARQYLGLCRDALNGIGLVVQDHDGDPYHPGHRLEVISFEDDPAAETERVVRTVRPSIYFQDRHIQTGQVVVAGPEAGAADGTSA